MDLCLNIEAEAVMRPVDELFYHLKYSWFGRPVNSYVSMKPFAFSVDELFDQERHHKPIYPLFDIMRLIQFSRSGSTKQCIRCGNYTEAQVIQTHGNRNQQQHQHHLNAATKMNSIYIQDSSSDKCLCGGYWILSSLQ